MRGFFFSGMRGLTTFPDFLRVTAYKRPLPHRNIAMPPLPRRRRVVPLAVAAAIASALALPAGSAPSQIPETQVWIDVSTHNFAGMPDMGAMGGLTGRMMGAPKEDLRYPTARHAVGTSGQYLDVALYNSLKPGVEAQHAIPGGLKLGKSLPLVPPVPEPTSHTPGTVEGKMPDIEFTIHEYWGCGATVRPGQPKTFKVKAQGGNVQTSGSVSQGMFAPDRDVDVTPAYAVWPNPKNGKRVPNGAVLAGSHRISGNGVPESLKFELGQNAEFMPKIALGTQGQATDAIVVNWRPVDLARAYFLNAFSMQNQNTMVVWSSAETAGAGQGLQQYLTGSYIERWLKDKVLLPTSVTSCTIPKGIFAASGGAPAQGGMGGMSMLGMIAYGPETNLVWPPRPTDAEELKKWDPEWNVRVRTKSTAAVMLGMDLGGMDASGQPDPDQADDEQPQEEEGKSKKLLRGLLRNL